jgi:hypothetical protein
MTFVTDSVQKREWAARYFGEDIETRDFVLREVLDKSWDWDSSVRIATELRAGRSGDRIPVEARFFLHQSTLALGPTQSPIQCLPAVAHPAIFSGGGGGGSTNSVEDRGQRELGSGGGSPLVRGSAQFAKE